MSLETSIYKLQTELKNLKDSGHNISSKAYTDRKKLLQKKKLMLKSKKRKRNRTEPTYASGSKINSKLNDLEQFLKNEGVNPLKINSNSRKMLSNANNQQQKLNNLFKSSEYYINRINQNSNSLGRPLIPFKNDCECKPSVKRVGSVNITNNTCYCNVARNHRKHIRNTKGKKSLKSRLIGFFKRSRNTSGLGKGRKSKKGKSKSK